MKPYRVRFPKSDSKKLDQDEVTFSLYEGSERREIRFHDYPDIFDRPGLYEQIYHGRLRCESPSKIASVLHSAVDGSGEEIRTLWVLDFGAGNGGHRI